MKERERQRESEGKSIGCFDSGAGYNGHHNICPSTLPLVTNSSNHLAINMMTYYKVPYSFLQHNKIFKTAYFAASC